MTGVPKPVRAAHQKCPRCSRAMTPRALLRHVPKCGRPNRLGSRAMKHRLDGYTFDSGLERRLYGMLKERVELGEITDFEVKPRVRLTKAQIVCIPDFTAKQTGQRIYYEAKGFEAERWLMIRKLWKFYGPGPLFVFKADRRGYPVLVETISYGGYE